MTDYTITDTYTDAKYNLDDKEIWNDFRGVIPNGYRTVIDGVTYVHADTKSRVLDSDSALKYGRRVRLVRYYTHAEWADYLAEFARHKYNEPYPEITIFLAGESDSMIADIFAIKMTDRIYLTDTEMGMTKWFWINKYTLYSDVKHNMPILELKLEEIRDEYLTGWFMIDTDEIDGSKLIG